MSSEVAPILTFTLQPVCLVNRVTQSTFGSVEPFSTYPAQATMLTCPSPGPSCASLGMLGGTKPVVPGAPVFAVLPQPAASASAPATVIQRVTPAARICCSDR